MTDELKHSTVGTSLTQTEFEGVGLHVCNSQATGDLIHASSSSQLSRLGIGSEGQVLTTVSGAPSWASGGVSDHGNLSGLDDDDHTQYVLHSDVDDTPVDGVTGDPISSNWAYDHDANASAHHAKYTDAEALTAAKAGEGIADNDIVQIDDADAADNDYAKFTAAGLEGRSYSEVLADLSGQAGAAFDWNGQDLTNLGTLGAFTLGGVLDAGDYNISNFGQFTSYDSPYTYIGRNGGAGLRLATKTSGSASQIVLSLSGNTDAPTATWLAALTHSNFTLDVNGIDVDPGSDVTADLITVMVTGTPRLYWEEPGDRFRFSHGVLLGGTTEIDGDVHLDGNQLIFRTSADPSVSADRVKVGGYDIGAGQRVLAISCEEAVTTESSTPDTTLLVRINGATYKWVLEAV